MFKDLTLLALSVLLISASAAAVNDIRTQTTQPKTSPIYYGGILSLLVGILVMIYSGYTISQLVTEKMAIQKAAAAQSAQAAATVVAAGQ